jgi:hypothetical protein
MSMTPSIPLWQVYELALQSNKRYANPVQEAALTVRFTSPSGNKRTIYGFWDGGDTWRARFAPDEIGEWTFIAICSDETNSGLHQQTGHFTCGDPAGSTRFEQHGPIRLSDNRRYFAHADGAPFFWMADTAWNGPLRSTDEEWQHYITERVRQQFTAVQWVATQWLTAPDGDIEGQQAYSGNERIEINPAFFQRLDKKLEALVRAGLLNVITLLWAAEWRPEPEINATNPGFALPEDQAILLARYMVARWNAYPVAYFLPGDGPYLGEKAARWKRIGQGVFASIDHAPVTLHPNGMSWYVNEFDDQDWLDYIGYQSGHGDDVPTVSWLVDGPPATGWQHLRPRPIVNLEPPYEDHIGYQSRQRFTADDVRKRLYWSLLVSPTAGVTYGGHGVWGWDDGTEPPLNHPTTGVPKPWREALLLPGAEQVIHLTDFFNAIDWWRLLPAREMVVNQPGAHRHIAASRSAAGDLAVVYVPEDRQIELNLDGLRPALNTTWFNPRTGERCAALGQQGRFETPAPGDWLLLFA